jgi:hypothetical protein
MKYVVYTAVFGDYDTIKPREFDSACDFICFTDDEDLQVSGWKFVFPDVDGEPANISNRRYKILPHRYLPTHDVSLYVDGNIDVVRDPTPLFEKYANHDFCAIQHFKRSCAYEEAQALLTSDKLDDSEKQLLKSQFDRYASEGFPESCGLTENNVLMRKNKANVRELMELWWQELIAGAPRDQLSLSYAGWRLDEKISCMDEGPRDRQQYFSIRLHKPETRLRFISRLRRIAVARKYQNPGYRLISILYGLADRVLSVFR